MQYPQPRRGRRRRSMHIIVVLLLASGGLRLVAQAAPAIAEAGTDTSSIAEQSAALDEGGFLAALQSREERLAAREEAFAQRMAVLESAEAELAEQLAQLQAAEAALRQTIAMAETASQQDVSRLTAVYENMKPREAAALFAEMEPEFAAGFLGLMRADVAALIMTELDPDIAYAFSVVLAGRNADIPQDQTLTED